MKSKSLLNIILNLFRREKSTSIKDINMNEIEDKVKNSEIFNNNFIETDANYFSNLIPIIREKNAQRKIKKRKIYFSTSFATSLSVLILYFTIFNTKVKELEISETFTTDEVNAILINEDFINDENIYSLVGEEVLEKIEDDYSTEIKPEYYEEIKRYNIIFDIKDLDQEMLQAFHDKLINTKILGDL